MRFMTVVRSPEGAGPPPQAFLEAIGALSQEAAAAGVLVDTGGLLPSSRGARIRLSQGKLQVTDGPFTETKELIGGFAVYDVATRAEAVEWSARFMQLHSDHWPGWEGEIEIREIFDPSAFEGPPSA